MGVNTDAERGAEVFGVKTDTEDGAGRPAGD